MTLPRVTWSGLFGLTIVIGCSAEAPLGDATRKDAGVVDARVDGWGWSAPSSDARSYEPSFYAVYYEVLLPSCGLVFCHNADGYFTLATPEDAYSSLVSAPATSSECAKTGLYRIHAGSPEQSLLYLKLTAPPCGKLMPLTLGGSIPLEARLIEQIKGWIERGALPFEGQ